MGRKRKFGIAEVVTSRGRPAVVVDYRQDTRGRGQYRIVRLTSLPSGRGYGPAIWQDSHLLLPYPWDDARPTAVKMYRANERLGDADRGCACQCCAHVAIPPGMIRSDGTLEGEE